MERRGGEWDREMTAGRIRTRVPVGVQARIWLGLLLAPQCPPHLGFLCAFFPPLFRNVISKQWCELNRNFCVPLLP